MTNPITRLPPHIAIGAVLILGFALFAVQQVLVVRSMRADVTDRVSCLITIQSLRSAVAAEESELAREHARDVVDGVLPLGSQELAARATGLPVALEQHLEVKSTDSLAALEQHLDALTVGLRAETGAISRSLGERWTAITGIVGAALVLAAALLVFMVIAERRRQEAERLARQLELMNLELSVAKDDALAANRGMTTFLANVSHAFRTPMQGLLGVAGLLRHTTLSDEQLDHLEVISRSAEGLMDLVEQLLDYSRLEVAHVDLAHAELDLVELLEECVALLAPRATRAGLDLTLHVAADVPRRVRGDGPRLRRIVLNLISNAVKFTEEGFVAVRVAAAAGEDGWTDLRIEVQDTGVGISKEDQVDLFDAFTQFGKAEGVGSGLGLAIVMGLVELMDGELGVESVPGDGSNFWVKLPLRVVDAESRAVQGGEVLAGSMILCADSSENNRAILEEELGAAGALVTCVGGGEAALAALDTGRAPQLLILRLDGERSDLHLLDALRSRAPASRLTIIITTPLTVDASELVPRYALAGIMERPLRPSRIARRVGRMVREAGLGTPRRVSGPQRLSSDTPAILVVEDNELNRRVAATLLRREGYDVQVAANGAEAVRKVAEHDYALVLMDVRMPEMDGLHALELIRAAEATSGRRTPIVAMTGEAAPGEEQRYLDLGMDGFLAKPVRPELLRSTVAEWVDRAREVARASG